MDDIASLPPPPPPLPPPQRLEVLPGQRLFWRLAYGGLGGFLGLVLGSLLGGLLISLSVELGAFRPLWLLPGIALGLASALGGWLYAQLRFTHYQGEHHPDVGVSLRDGVWWQAETWVPIARLQHLDMSQGPLDRRWGMAKLSLHTAGTHEQVLVIRGLPVAQAQALRAALLVHLHHRHD